MPGELLPSRPDSLSGRRTAPAQPSPQATVHGSGWRGIDPPGGRVAMAGEAGEGYDRATRGRRVGDAGQFVVRRVVRVDEHALRRCSAGYENQVGFEWAPRRQRVG